MVHRKRQKRAGSSVQRANRSAWPPSGCVSRALQPHESSHQAVLQNGLSIALGDAAPCSWTSPSAIPLTESFEHEELSRGVAPI